MRLYTRYKMFNQDIFETIYNKVLFVFAGNGNISSTIRIVGLLKVRMAGRDYNNCQNAFIKLIQNL